MSLLQGTHAPEQNSFPPFFAAPEAEFAHAIQKTLVPTVERRHDAMEAYGRTIPLNQIGGDLLDVVDVGGNAVACVADVSGHGFRAAVLMGMIKTAMRYGLLLDQPLPRLFDSLNRVLPAVKESSMFATLAALRFDGSHVLEYVSAGHVPMLHYRRRQREVLRHRMSQFPPGLFENINYTNARIPYEPGDVFALVTDGVVETFDDAGSEFGLEPLGHILCSMEDYPLPEMFDVALSAVIEHGEQQDDRTLLLIRALS